jgi:hypothetical protein
MAFVAFGACFRYHNKIGVRHSLDELKTTKDIIMEDGLKKEKVYL